MAFPGNVTRYVISGSMAGGEKWAVGVYGAPLDESVSMQSLADSTVSRPAFSNMLTAWRSLVPAQVSADRLQTYRYTSGRAAVDNGSASLSVVGNGTGGTHPNQIALVTTLRTSVTNRTGRGRMYWPANGVSITSGGIFLAATVNAFVDALALWLQDIQARVVSETATVSRNVTGVDADYIPDTQRARSKSLASTRYRKPVTF